MMTPQQARTILRAIRLGRKLHDRVRLNTPYTLTPRPIRHLETWEQKLARLLSALVDAA